MLLLLLICQPLRLMAPPYDARRRHIRYDTPLIAYDIIA